MAGSPPRPALLRGAALALCTALLLGLFSSAQAQTEARYFPETGHSLRGAFRAFWETNGALGTFGYPISEEFAGQNGRATQWFERARFELTEVNGQARVELGLLGIEATSGRIFPKVPPIENTAERRYIPETQHIIQYGFKEIWETRGDVRLFGYPISEEIDEVLDDGEWHTVQYFERVRFEYWPNFPPGQRVLLSNLGRKLAPPALTAPIGQPGQPGQPTQPPAPAPAVPASVNARVSPQSGPPGTTFVFDASGFQPGEQVGVWLTAPDQSTFGADFQVPADDKGSIGYRQIGITSDSSFAAGVWSFNAQGVRSGAQAIGYFLISSAVSAGDPNRLGLIVHDQLPVQGQAVIYPLAAPAGTTFILVGDGFAADEALSAWVTGPDGKSTPIDASQVSRDGTSTQVLFSSAGLPDGIYTAVAQGQRSQVIAAAAFKLTRDYVAGPGTARPASNGGSATPPEGGAGTVFQLRGQGLRPGEQLDFWVTDPTGSYVLFPDRPVADAEGRVGYNPPLDLKVDSKTLPGVYGIHFRGRSSGARVDIYFSVLGAAKGQPDAALQLAERLINQGWAGRPQLWLR